MKYYSIIAFTSALVNSVLGISIGCGKLKGFVNTICKKPERYKILSRYFIVIGVIMMSSGFVSFSESTASIIYIIVSILAESVILSLMRYEN